MKNQWRRRAPRVSSALPLCAAALCAMCAAAAAQDAAALGKIARIDFITTDGVAADDAYARAHTASREGAALDPKLVAADVRKLLDSGRFSYVGTRFSETNGAPALAFMLEMRKRVTGEVLFEGVTAFWSDKQVREAFGLSAGSFFDAQVLAAAAARVQNLYAEKKGILGVEVKIEALPIESGHVLRVIVDEGAQERTAPIRFFGNRSISARDLRRHSGQSPWWNPGGWFTRTRVSDFDLELMKADIVRQYHDKGMLDAAAEGPFITSAGGRRHVSYRINEGPVYRVGTVEARGVTLFPQSSVLRAARLAPGDVAGAGAIERARAAVEAYFRSRGYVDTRVAALTFPDEARAGVLNIAFSVKEGALARVGAIMIHGNSTTKDKVARREISLNPGDIYDGMAFERSRRRLQNLGYFENVAAYDRKSEKDPAVRDLIFDMDERSTGSLMVGAGFSTVDHLIGLFEVSQSNFDIMNWPNFTGGGQKARLSAQIGSDSSDVEVDWTEPWLFDQRLALDVNGFIRNRSYSEYDERKAGAGVGLARHIPWIGRVGLSYTLQGVALSDAMPGDFPLADDPSEIFRYTDEDDSYLLGSLRLSWTYDTRNRPMLPTYGTRATFGATLHNSILGSDIDFYELDLRAKRHFPLFYGHTLALSARAAVVDSYGGDEVPISSRLFLGGGSSVRGFRYRNIGPKAVRRAAQASEPLRIGGAEFHPVGGRTLLEASAEYSIPLAGPLRLAFFYDIGNVWADPYDFNASEYASSAGAGLRLDFPGFPIRLDYAYALSQDDDLTRRRAFVFWVGLD